MSIIQVEVELIDAKEKLRLQETVIRSNNQAILDLTAELEKKERIITDQQRKIDELEKVIKISKEFKPIYG